MKRALKRISKVSGNLFGIWGNIDDCDLSDDDRKKGIDVQDLICQNKEGQK